MPTDDELPLILRAQQGDHRAQQELIRRHERQISVIVEPYVGIFERADLEQEGRIGLLVAMMRFDPRRNFRFVTFSEFYVRRFVIDHARSFSATIRVPEDAIEAYRAVLYQCHEWERQGRIFTLSEAAEKCGHDPELIYRVRASLDIDKSQFAPTRIDQVSDEEPDFVNEVERAIDHGELRRIIVDALPKLPHQERYVIKWYYGIDCKPRSLARIAKYWGLDPSRISQIHTKAKRSLAKLIADDIINHTGEA